ncbi:MAG: hypothetical protein HKN62_12290 [Phycisphaerales bacterium]|nr:hypothetical protein [Phycisphaerales bacterium]
MPMTRVFRIIPFAALAALVLATGCTSVTEVFPGERADHVWAAMVAVAETPEYETDDPTERWTVRENEVWVDEENARIEIYRTLDRVLHQPRTRPVRQQRTWRLQVWFDSTEPPVATVVSRGAAVPMHAAGEADRYFADVWNVLEGSPPATRDMPPAMPDVPIIEPTPPEVDDPTRPIIDIDDLEPR